MEKFNRQKLIDSTKALEIPELPDMVWFYGINIPSTEHPHELLERQKPFRLRAYLINKKNIEVANIVQKEIGYYVKDPKGRMTQNGVYYKGVSLISFPLIELRHKIGNLEGGNLEGVFSLDDLEKIYNQCYDKIQTLKFLDAPNSIKYIVDKED